MLKLCQEIATPRHVDKGPMRNLTIPFAALRAAHETLNLTHAPSTRACEGSTVAGTKEACSIIRNRFERAVAIELFKRAEPFFGRVQLLESLSTFTRPV